MKKHIVLALAFALAAAPAAAHQSFDIGHDFNDRGFDFENTVPRDLQPQQRSCAQRDIARMDLGGGWSLGLRGGLKDPTVTLRWRKSLQPHLERGGQRGCALLGPGGFGG
jgi:hypothetical protein